VLFHLGGAVSRVDDEATAYTGRNSPHNININGVWRPDEEEEYAGSEIAWTRRFFDGLEPHREGVYVNFLDADDDTQRVRESYGEYTYRRLASIKTEYDPDNVFHLNQNIEPTVWEVLPRHFFEVQAILADRLPETFRPVGVGSKIELPPDQG